MTAALLAYGLLGTGGGPLPGVDELAVRAGGTVLYGALMGALGAPWAWRCARPPRRSSPILVVLLALDPLLAGLSTEIARWGLGGAAGALTGSGADDLPPAWAGGLALLAYCDRCSRRVGDRAHRPRDVP